MRTGFKTVLQRNRSVVILSVQLSIWIIFSLTWARVVDSAVFNCSSGDVTCLIAAINEANGIPGEHIINLAPGIYTLRTLDNETDGANGLPSIKSSIHIRASSEDEQPEINTNPDIDSPFFRIFHVSAAGKLTLEGVILRRTSSAEGGTAILNRGITLLRDSIVMNTRGEVGAIWNFGALNVLRSIITQNSHQFFGGGIFNELGGNVLIEDSTFSANFGTGGGAIENKGSLIVRNSSFVFNFAEGGGGITNRGGHAEIVNSTIAENQAYFGSGGGIDNTSFIDSCCDALHGQLTIINSTIRENRGIRGSSPGGIANDFFATVRIQNTIIAGNTTDNPDFVAPDCSGVILSLGNNLIGDPSGCTINLQASDLTGDPGLGILVGAEEDVPPGRTFYPVLAGSAVIDKANPAACPETDQLGNPRVGTCDIGAIEFPSPPAPAIVNNLFSFVPLTATFKTTSNTVDCPFFVGKFSFDARLTNTTKGVTLSNLILRVTTLTNFNALKRADGVLLIEPDPNLPPGFGLTSKIVSADHFLDGLLSPGEFVDQPFTICLHTKERFSFFVDVLGIESDNAANSMALR